jgi:hypothetical protein
MVQFEHHFPNRLPRIIDVVKSNPIRAREAIVGEIENRNSSVHPMFWRIETGDA